jgi:hypothetical protein
MGKLDENGAALVAKQLAQSYMKVKCAVLFPLVKLKRDL